MKISVCGKGGSGKSTVSALLAGNALKKGMQVLVVDADDSNTGLSRMVGFEHPPTPLMSLVGGKKGIKEKMGYGGGLLSAPHIRLKDIPAEYMVKHNGLMQVGIGKILQSLEGCACPMGGAVPGIPEKACFGRPRNRHCRHGSGSGTFRQGGNRGH
jgi:CO dehydrogenase maturation factor